MLNKKSQIIIYSTIATIILLILLAAVITFLILRHRKKISQKVNSKASYNKISTDNNNQIKTLENPS
jgi:preprotein translocase subunit YajC